MVNGISIQRHQLQGPSQLKDPLYFTLHLGYERETDFYKCALIIIIIMSSLLFKQKVEHILVGKSSYIIHIRHKNGFLF